MDFDESLLKSKFQYAYEEDNEPSPSEYYNSRRIEDFILSKGFLILEYFVVRGLCSFILIQLPSICETMMVYVNRHKYPIRVTSSYRKTELERLKIEKRDDDTNDYENMALTGFDVSHSLDKISDTNIQQKSLSYYVHRQIQRMMYVTKNIDIKPCLILNGIFGFYEVYQVVGRSTSKEFYPVISLEILFSKTFLLEQNIPVFYQKFYGIINQSNRNKLEYLSNSLTVLLTRVKQMKQREQDVSQHEIDKKRVKTVLARIDDKHKEIENERTSTKQTDLISGSYLTKKLNERIEQLDAKRSDCNKIYAEIKNSYDKEVMEQEITFHELYYKIRDIEEMIGYLT